MSRRPVAPEESRSGPLSAFLAARGRLIENRPSVDPWQTGNAISEALVAELDAAVTSLTPPGTAVVAVGGYGRRRLSPFSDVDIMLLHEGSVTTEEARPLLYPLWDAHLRVGHSVRTVREAVGAARADLETLTSLLTGRLVAGREDLWAQATDGLTALVRRERERILAALREAERERRESEPYRLLALDVKAGRGGLRCLDGVVWERAVLERLDRADPAPATDEEDGALAVLSSVRAALHAVGGRAVEVFHHELRNPVGEWLGLPGAEVAAELQRGVRAAEGIVEDRWPALWESTSPDPVMMAGRWLVRAFRKRPGNEHGDAEVWSLASRVLDRGTPRRFEAIDELRIRMAPAPRWTEDDRAAFVRILGSGLAGRRIVERLERLGWLERALPELTAVRALPEAAPFHTHPVDEHLWRTVAEAIDLTSDESDEPWCRALSDELGSLDELLVASLFHDVGKGRGGDHSMVGGELVDGFGRRAGFSDASTRLMADAVRHHLLLISDATRRDIGDPAVVADVAARIGDRRLALLLPILTAADARATGPGSWGAWTSVLVRTLASRVIARLGGSAPSVDEVADVAAAVAGVLGPDADVETIRERVTAMPAGYLHRYEVAEIAAHYSALHPPPRPGEVRLAVTHAEEFSTLVVAARDEPGLLVAAAGVLTLHRLEILDAHLMTTGDGLALDSFTVRRGGVGGPAPEHVVALIERDLNDVRSGGLDLEAALESRRRAVRGRAGTAGDRAVGMPDGVRVRSAVDPGSGAPLIQIRAQDRVGLLHDVALVLARHGVDVRVAKVDTRRGLANDTFHLAPGAAIPDGLLTRLGDVLAGG